MNNEPNDIRDTRELAYTLVRAALAQMPRWSSIHTLLVALVNQLAGPSWDAPSFVQRLLLRFIEPCLVGQTAVLDAMFHLSEAFEGECRTKAISTTQELRNQLAKTSALLLDALRYRAVLNEAEVSALEGAVWALSTTDLEDRADFLQRGLEQLHFLEVHGKRVAYLRRELMPKTNPWQ
jgi:hypothetical protein